MDKSNLIDVAELIQGEISDVLLAGVMVGDCLEDELRFGRTEYRDYTRYALAGLRVLHNELERIHGELTAGIDAEFEKRKG